MIDSTNTTFNARDVLLARIYKQLRIADQDEPLRDEALKLYNQITLALIGVTERIYDETKPQNEEDPRKNREAITESKMRLDDQGGLYSSGGTSENR